MRSLALAALLLLPLPLHAQRAESLAAPDEPSARLRSTLPGEVAARISRLAADAREHRLPGHAIESAALELRAKGATPAVVERRVTLFARQLAEARTAMTAARDTAPSDAELTAAASAIGRGITPAAIRELADRAPVARDLALPLFVASALVDRGLPPRDAVDRVATRLASRATDAELLALPDELFGLPPVPGLAGGVPERWRAIGAAGMTRGAAGAVGAPANTGTLRGVKP